MSDFETARRNMVDGQLRPNKVTDSRILDAMETLPRETFMDKAHQGIAYVDEDIEVAPGRFLMEPVVLARLVQALELEKSDSVLVIGAATGYDAALIGMLAGPVVAIESDAALVEQSSMVLNHLGIDNVAVIEAPLADGYAGQAPYDVVFFSGAVPDIPGNTTDQVAPGGRIAAVVSEGENGILGRAHLMMRIDQGLSGRPIFDAGTHALPGFEQTPEFVF
ncbi:MAG: protein-L-isoaspartate O-methyltransferase [Alphaproteobacteria bacterium]|mgnify:CR=1 FL=1|nr:protein-L-isoaspartate O-methyltransferase [Alphaproteobacteria bacterium]|tara:strand:+ start:205 stop:867 length:663 start_codon:yes stop_codon:yes gene_type:complete